MEQPIKILLLEDNLLDVEMIQRLLRKENIVADYRMAKGKNSFLLGLDEFAPDLIISDHSLPQFSSLLALKFAREKFPGIPFILVTGTISEEFAVNVIKQGADDFILKDRMSRLPAAIKNALKRRETERENNMVSQQLKGNEERYQTIMERVSDGFVALDRNWNYTYVNKKAAEILNRSSELLLGNSIWTDFPEGVGNAFYKAYHLSMKLQEYIHLEEYYQPFDVWLENHIYPSPEGLSIFFRDISEKKKAELKIKESEENLKTIFDNSSEAFILLDEKGIIKAFNKNAEAGVFVNATSKISPNHLISEYLEPELKTSFIAMFGKALEGHTISYEQSFDKNGERLWLSISLTPVKKDHSISGICVTGRNITEKKIADRQKEFDHNNLHALINNTHDLVWSVDLNMNLITSNDSFNQTMRSVSGVVPLPGTNILSAAPDETQANNYRDYYHRAFNGERFIIIDSNHLSNDTWSETSFHPIYENQKVIGTACFSRDITERKKAEQEFVRLEKERLSNKVNEQRKITCAMLDAQEKERIAIGTELHDNVNQILVGSNLLLSMVKSKPENYLELVESAMKYIKEAIDENRKIAHVSVAPDFHNETLTEMIEKLIEKMLAPVGIISKLSLLNFKDKLLSPERKINLYRIAQEQCTNIIKYARASTVLFTLNMSEEALIVTIADNGIGMDANQKPTGIGLKNISDRLSLFNGTSCIHTKQGEGFELELMMPL